MTDTNIPEPTAEQCSANAKVYESDSLTGYAIWYPQMGGYVGKAVVLLGASRCFDVLVWHNGEFPFNSEDGEQPVRLHHCDPQQFITFGQTVAELNERSRQVTA